jgi:hypothetical protein
MNKLIAILLATAFVTANAAFAASYSTEATMTRQKDQNTYEVNVHISHLIERNGTVAEEVIQRPRLISSPGVPASLHCGLSASDPNYAKDENVSVDVSWPETGKRDFAVCTVVIKLGDKIVSKTKMRVTVEEG